MAVESGTAVWLGTWTGLVKRLDLEMRAVTDTFDPSGGEVFLVLMCVRCCVCVDVLVLMCL